MERDSTAEPMSGFTQLKLTAAPSLILEQSWPSQMHLCSWFSTCDFPVLPVITHSVTMAANKGLKIWPVL